MDCDHEQSSLTRPQNDDDSWPESSSNYPVFYFGVNNGTVDDESCDEYISDEDFLWREDDVHDSGGEEDAGQPAVTISYEVMPGALYSFAIALPVYNVNDAAMVVTMENSNGVTYNGAVPAAKEAVLDLKVGKFEAIAGGSGEEDICVVCRDEFIDGVDSIAYMPCKHHQFHADCLFSWLERSGVCPICRKELPRATD